MKHSIHFTQAWSLIATMVFWSADAYAQEGMENPCGLQEVAAALEMELPLVRPILSGPVSYIVTTNFRVHYTTQGKDATTQAYADSVSRYAEYSWSVQCSTHGWDTPPPDGSNGGDGRYDIYIRDTTAAGGFTADGRVIPEARTTNPNQDEWTSWMEIRKGLSYNYLKFVVAHEFNHSSQLSYTRADMGSGGTWFYENTATWMTDIVYPTLKKYVDYVNHSTGPLVKPYTKITHTGGTDDLYEYGGALWCFLLSEWKDSLAVRRCWERMGETPGQQILRDIDWVLANRYSSSLTEALRTYALWRYFTHDRSDAYHFRDASLYLARFDSRFTSYPVAESTTVAVWRPAGPGGTRFIDFVSGSGTIRIIFDGQDGHRWAAWIIGFRSPGPSVVYLMNLNQNAFGDTSFVWGSNQHFALVPVVLDTARNAPQVGFRIAASISAATTPITFINQIGTTNAGGRLLLDGADTVLSGESRNLPENSSHMVRTLQERFERPDSTYKHHNWRGVSTDFRLSKQFVARPDEHQNARFIGLNPVTVRNELIDAPAAEGGIVRFRDPWFLEQAGNQPDTFRTWSSPHRPPGAWNQEPSGVFLNQGNPPYWDKPYYSIRVPETQPNIAGFGAHLLGWESSGADLAAESAPSGWSGRSVVFRNANAEVKARYKAHMGSNTPRSPQHQRPAEIHPVAALYRPSMDRLQLCVRIRWPDLGGNQLEYGGNVGQGATH